MSLFRFIAIVWLVCFAGNCVAGSTTTLYYYEDVSGNDTLEQVLYKPFEKVEQDVFSAGFSSSVFWIKVKDDRFTMDKLIASSCYTQIDSFDAFIPESAGWREVNSGDTKPFKWRSILHPCFVFDLSKMDQSEVFFRLASNGIIKLPLKIQEQNSFWQEEQRRQLLQGIFFAFLCAMFIYNLFLFVVIRESAYLYYVFYLGAIALFLASMSGHSHMYFWPNSTRWSDMAPVALASVAISSALLFIRNMTQINVYFPGLANWMGYFACSSLPVLIIININTKYAIALLGVQMLITLSLMFYAIFISAAQRFKPSYFLVSGILLMVFGGIIYFGRTLGWLNESWLTNNILHLTTSAEAMVLSFALAYRVRMLNQQLEKHKNDSLLAQSRLSQSLLEGADHERRAIARELHDSFGQGLIVIKSMISRLRPVEQQEQAVSQLRELISDMRNMARNMHPQQIESLGFSTALETMFTDMMVPNRMKLLFELDDVNGMIDRDSELQLYRIAQESASNIVKHAKATEVRVDLVVLNQCLTFMICDNGIGMSAGGSHGMGILNMTERAALIGARFAIQAAQPQGTKVVVEVPL